jgi:hypothetical protein
VGQPAIPDINGLPMIQSFVLLDRLMLNPIVKIEHFDYYHQ